MTAYQLSSTRIVLERARLLLRERQDEDANASELLGSVCEVIHAIAASEATDSYADGPWLLSRARALVERTRAYAERNGLHFLIALTPRPGKPDRHDTSKSINVNDVLAAIAEMDRESMLPPPELQERISEDQLVPLDTIPSPPETVADLMAEGLTHLDEDPEGEE